MKRARQATAAAAETDQFRLLNDHRQEQHQPPLTIRQGGQFEREVLSRKTVRLEDWV